MAYSKIPRLLVSISALLLFYSCQENSESLDLDSLNPKVDYEMIQALNLADAYLESITSKNGRTGSTDRSVTNLKYHNDNLVYKTNEITNGYDQIGEQTVSAFVIPGEYIFWHTGGGITDIVGIEFDSYSMQFLESEPIRTSSQLWMVKIKSLEEDYDDDEDERDENDDEDEDIHLKYDIIYKTKESGNTPIRLDPKIKIRQQK